MRIPLFSHFRLLVWAVLLTGMVAAYDFPSFFSSDPVHDQAANEMLRLHARPDISDSSLFDPIWGIGPGQGSVNLWRDYEIDMLYWHDFSTNNYVTGNRPQFIRDSIVLNPVDRFGYVFIAMDVALPGDNQPNTFFGMGWPFPGYESSLGNSVGWEFNGTNSEGWTSVNADAGTVASGFWNASTTQSDPLLLSPAFSVDTVHAPFVQLDIQYASMAGLTGEEKKFQLYWTTTEEPAFSEDKSVTSDRFPVIPVDQVSTQPQRRMWLPMYLHPKWQGKRVTRLRLDPITNAVPRTAAWRLNYIRLDYDTRHAIGNSTWVRATARKFLWDRDANFLKVQLPRMRQAVQCLLTNFQSSQTRGVDLGWLTGHTGRGWIAGSPPTQRVGQGIGNNYFDLLPMGPRDILTDIQYYRMLQAMAKIEQHIANNPSLDSARPFIYTRDGATTVTYAETAASLMARIEPTRQMIHNTFWNPATGRYAGWRDADGVLHDYGYAHMNVEALEAGIPDQASAQSIIDWLDGRRTVAGDTSTGADIYHFAFAARISTRRNLYDYLWGWAGYTVPFGNQIQDGGATLFTTFYDVKGRLRYGDRQGAWNVWQRMLAHHRTVQAAGGKGPQFYRKYYQDNPSSGSLQGGGSAGGLGLDIEFIESMLAPVAWVHGWLGIDTPEPNVLQIRPTLPPGLSHIGVQHLIYNNNDYRIRAERDVVDLAGTSLLIPGGTRLRITFAGLYGPNAQVLRNGQPFSGTLTREGNKLTIETAPTTDRFEVRDTNATPDWSRFE